MLADVLSPPLREEPVSVFTMAWLRRDAPTPPISTDEFGEAAGASRVVGPWCDRGNYA
jgi:hypothetical protein